MPGRRVYWAPWAFRFFRGRRIAGAGRFVGGSEGRAVSGE